MEQKHPLSFFGAVLSNLLLLVATAAHAQPDSTIALKPITVQATSLRQTATGTFTEHFDARPLARASHQSIADLLAAQTGIYVKSYGMGSLATLSLRGSSASQVAITWNGLPIQSPMLGLTDIALLPAFATDALTLQYGSSGASWGSGAVGGTLALRNLAPQRGFGGQYNGAVGSFGSRSHQAKAHWAGRKLALTLRWANARADNDFNYPLTDSIQRTQTNASVAQQFFMPELYWRPNTRMQWSAHLWRQTNQRQIPPLTTQTRSTASQADSVWRGVVQGHFLYKKHVFLTKIAYFNEKIFYQDPISLLKAPSQFETHWAELEDRWQPNSHWALQIGAQAVRYHAIAKGYAEGHGEHRQAVFGSARYSVRRWQVQTSIRQEWQDGRVVPVIPSLGAQWQRDSVFQWRIKLDRHYRLPTLNDRYWQPGGNSNLRPEQGWGGETGITFAPLPALRYTATLHARQMDDWILWAIAEGQSFFSANNITTVRSYGAEQRLKGQFYLPLRTRLQYATGADYVRSIVQKTVTKPNLPKGSQLAYTPVWRAFAQASVGNGHWQLGWNAQYTAAAEGFNESIPAFWVHHFTAEAAFGPNQHGGKIYFQVNNLFNKPYQVIERRPMPGRWFMAGVTVYFSKFYAD